jgi:sortase (surface protein transpeptidase)
MALGLGLVAWVGVTLWWGEPFTSLYTRHEQKALSKELQALDRKWSGTVRLSPAVPSRRAEAGTAETSVGAALRTRAAAYRRTLRDGRAFGRIIVPRLGLDMAVIEGTSEPYGTFRYRVYYHRVVDAREWRILRRRPFEKLVLTACHPLYSASHRFVVYARLKSQAYRHAA